MTVFAFDVDRTLTISGGPIPVEVLQELRDSGHVVGICGNWEVFVREVKDWHKIVSFVGPMEMPKARFLSQLKTFIHDQSEFIMVGNIGGGLSEDAAAAAMAKWTFVKDREFIDFIKARDERLAQMSGLIRQIRDSLLGYLENFKEFPSELRSDLPTEVVEDILTGVTLHLQKLG